MDVLVKINWDTQYQMNVHDAMKLVQIINDAQKVNVTYRDGAMVSILEDNDKVTFTNELYPLVEPEEKEESID